MDLDQKSLQSCQKITSHIQRKFNWQHLNLFNKKVPTLLIHIITLIAAVVYNNFIVKYKTNSRYCTQKVSNKNCHIHCNFIQNNEAERHKESERERERVHRTICKHVVIFWEMRRNIPCWHQITSKKCL